MTNPPTPRPPGNDTIAWVITFFYLMLYLYLLAGNLIVKFINAIVNSREQRQ